MSTVNPGLVADAPFYSPEHGEFLSSHAARLQAVLKDYNPYLELVFVPTNKRDATDTHPYAIRDNSPWRRGYIVKRITEQEMGNPEKILAWLFEGDLSKHSLNEIMNRELAEKAANELLRMKREQDIAEERRELSEQIIKGGRYKKSVYRHNGKIFTDGGARDVTQTIH